MPAFFKPRRRRGPAGPNKNEQKVLRRASAERDARSAGGLKDRFPTVDSVAFLFTFITPQQEVYETGSRKISSTEVADFFAACPGRCGGERGSFDLAEEMKTAIESGKERVEGRIICQETMNIGTVGTCDFRLEWKATITYAPAE
jgi:hypothetical protein